MSEHPITENVMRAYEWYNSKLTQDPLECIGQHRNEYECMDPDSFFIHLPNLFKLVKITADRAEVCVRGSFETNMNLTPGSNGAVLDFRMWKWGNAGVVEYIYKSNVIGDLPDLLLNVIDSVVSLNPEAFQYPVVKA